MEEPVFKIDKKKYRDESVVISLRIPKDMLKDIDALAQYTGHSRNEILQMGLEFAMEHMEVTSEEAKKKSFFAITQGIYSNN